MNELPQNPFEPTKIEHERDPVFWLSSRAKELASGMKHAHVAGSRGSGKTTLLRSLRTADIKSNPSLRNQYRRSVFDWFGTYIQFNRTLQTVVDNTTKAVIGYLRSLGTAHLIDEDQIAYRVFDFYLELTLLQAFVADIVAISDRRELSVSARLEQEVCARVLLKLGYDQKYGRADVYSLSTELQRTRALFTALPTETTMVALIEALNAFTPNDLLDEVVALIGGLRGQMIQKSRHIRPIVLIDDCESLLPQQQIILNTILKSFEGRIKFILAFIAGQYDSSSTTLPNTVLKDDDYLPIKLDEEPREKFVEFCEHVTRTRLEYYYNNGGGLLKRPLPTFKLNQVLGNPAPNTLIATMVSASMSQRVSSWAGEVSDTKRHLRTIIDRKNWSKLSIEDPQQPYIEHTLLRLLSTPLDSLKSIRQQDTFAKVVDRKQVAALVYIVKSHFRGQPVPYAGAQTVMNLSTGCIRDYLDIMGAIYEEAIGAIDREWSANRIPKLSHLIYFAEPKNPIRWDIQRSGILASSERKWKTLRDFSIKSAFDIVSLVHGLSSLLVNLQRPSNPKKAVSAPERGIFTFDSVQLDKVLEVRRLQVRSREIMRTLQRDGFIRLLGVPDEYSAAARRPALIEFQLHNRLYPELEISHRGPYGTVRLEEAHFALLIAGGGEIDPGKWAEAALPKGKSGLKQGEFGL
ncbi:MULTISPECIES: ORC-CDC6 family AAA ATPase [unclassified Sphingopyxis]|uniref:ORC-CDC6 family AAA ATPase n=1 Tax=unclassified Sphingopyxis TaxID=2614943 RepID=UPI000736FC53|nr:MULTISPECIES: hypothetical protein [unclassified Sphingopyxis]KTE42934.1 hypothetical protein ATE62_04260 [Sphingopyxis sp. HIX]KTE85240.1 hypothetical protein ATE72_05105 [Sphingopyxis sp. HXXIV]